MLWASAAILEVTQSFKIADFSAEYSVENENLGENKTIVYMYI